MLTGEGVPCRAATGELLYAGTFLVEGAAEAAVTATGAGTRIAQIATLTQQVRRPPGPLQVRLNRVIRVIGLIAVACGALLYLTGLALGLTALQGFVFALGVTVTLVPEGLLPTVTLASGWSTAKHLAAQGDRHRTAGAARLPGCADANARACRGMAVGLGVGACPARDSGRVRRRHMLQTAAAIC